MLFLLQVPDTTTIPAAVVNAVNRFTDLLLGYVIAIAAIGALAMALIEAGKKVLDSRTKFQAKRWTRWVSETAFDPAVIGVAWDVEEGRRRGFAEVIHLCTGESEKSSRAAASKLIESNGKVGILHAFDPSNANALFALEIERMMGSIQEAGDVALTAPKQYPGLYLLMTSGADPTDVKAWYEQGDAGLASIANNDPSPAERQQVKEMADRFGRLRQVMKRKLDAFQFYTGERWGSWNQMASNVLGALIMASVLIWIRETSDGPARIGVVEMVVLSLLGGVLAPVAKDLVTALKRAKNG